MDYSQYKAIDFVKDESFQEWCMHPEGRHAEFWTNWTNEHPEQHAEILAARQLLTELQESDTDLSDSKIDQLWEAIQASTRGTLVKPLPKSRKSTMIRWSRIAAIWVGLVMAVSLGIYWMSNQATTVTFATAYGEVKSISLPDGSRVVINGNSSLSYREKDFDADTRIVNLVGEAFFSVSHTPDHKRFVVQTNADMDVEVLGTKFTMTSRPMKKQVVLEEGKVKVSNSIYMDPGELVAWDADANRWREERVQDPSRYGSFKENRLIFRKTPLQEVARVLEDNYGYRITFVNPALAGKHFTGSCAADDIPLLLRSIEKAFGVTVEEDDRHIAIGKTN